jgi:hypothetical protein
LFQASCILVGTTNKRSFFIKLLRSVRWNYVGVYIHVLILVWQILFLPIKWLPRLFLQTQKDRTIECLGPYFAGVVTWFKKNISSKNWTSKLAFDSF